MTASVQSAVTYPSAPPAADAIVQVRGIHKNYDTVEALRDINLDFPRGALTSLLGPSGCGKTTLLKIIAGLIPPTSGEVRVNGKVVTRPGPERAFVFQDFALMPWATVQRNVAFGLELRGMGERERYEIARHYIAEVGLTGFEKRYPHELSGGMRQRAALARVLVNDPKILLMDEPFAALDAQTRARLQQEVAGLWTETKKTVFFVTHSVEEAVLLGDRVVAMTALPGRVKADVRVALARPRDPTSPEFNDLRRMLENLLIEEIAPEEAASFSPEHSAEIRRR